MKARTSRRKLLLLAGMILIGLLAVAGGIAVVFVGSQGLDLVGTLFGRSAASDDPLMKEEVEEELTRLPMPLDEWHRRLRAKQNYNSNYGVDVVEDLWERDVQSIKSKIARGRRLKSVHFSEGKGDSDVARLNWVTSWDGRARAEGGIHRTGQWFLLLDKDDIIIGYIDIVAGNVAEEEAWAARGSD